MVSNRSPMTPAASPPLSRSSMDGATPWALLPVRYRTRSILDNIVITPPLTGG